MSQHLEIMDVDLTGLVVLTGACGAYEEALATVAGLAGAARVIAVCQESKKRSQANAAAHNALPLAVFANVAGRVETLIRVDRACWPDVDILVSCPGLGPVTRSVVERLPPTAVVALMAEPWEIRPDLVDVEACGQMGIKIAAPNLGHPSIDLLPELAQRCCRLVSDAGVEPRGTRIAVLCDTPCGPFIERALTDRGAVDVQVFTHPMLLTRAAWDAVVVALRPSSSPPMDIKGLAAVMDKAGGAKLVQFSGEIDRVAANYFGFQVWPQRKPWRGRPGIAAEVLGPSAMVRRLVGGLKAAEAALHGAKLGSDEIGFVADRI